MATPNPMLARSAQLFPELTDAQIARVAAIGKRREIAAGEVLFDVGEQNTRFFVVLEGSIEVVLPVGDREQPVVLHGARQFTGEINMLSARRSLVRGRVKDAGAVIAVDRQDLRLLVQRDSELSEILLRAFILRRVALLAEGSDLDSRRLAALGEHAAHPGVLEPQRAALRLPGRRDRSERAGDARQLPRRRRGRSVDRLRAAATSSRTRRWRGWRTTLGLAGTFDATEVHDVIIVGAGPGGSGGRRLRRLRGPRVLVLDSTAAGGQAGTSSRIENYLGFPTGISGQALAGRARTQAEKFGAEIAVGRNVARLDCDSRPYRIFLADGQELRTRTIIVATGVQYRRLDLPMLARFEGVGIFYSATHLEGQLCVGEEVVVVGGGNSAGQAAVFLSQLASHVHVLVRGPGLAESMSRYLIQRIDSTPQHHAADPPFDRRPAGGRPPPERALAPPRHGRAGDPSHHATSSP